LKPVAWLHNFLLLLEGERLSMLDLEVLRELVLKMRVERSAQEECSNL
jgi:hypothetical protein